MTLPPPLAGSLLPPASTAAERAIEGAIAARFAIPVDVARLWNPWTCEAALLPWLGWGLSIDLWDADWSEAEKRAAVADALAFQMRKGTPASLRLVLDRFDPLIGLVEWFETNPPMPPHTFRLELPLPGDSDVVYDEALVLALLRDIQAVKPARAHMHAVHKLSLATSAHLAVAARSLSLSRMDAAIDSTIDPDWFEFLQTEIGEPILAETGDFLRV